MSTVIVVGAGGAGLTAAIEAANFGAQVLMLTKAAYTNTAYAWASNGGCTWKTHAFNAAISPGDSIDDHVRDTVVGGSYANNTALVRTLCEGSFQLVHWLEGLGLTFEKDGGKNFVTRPFGGCGSPRGVFLEDRLGFHIQQVLNRRVGTLVEQGRVRILTGLRAHRLLFTEEGSVRGIEAIAVDSLELLEIAGDAVVLADGGGASMYSPSATSVDKTCDGMAIGLGGGAEVIDMEYVQFHPTGLVSDVLSFDGSLVEEAIRFDGAILINRHGQRFMLNHDPRGEQATRDVVSRGIYREIRDGNAFDDGSVGLDISSCAHLIKKRYPALHERLLQAGFAPESVPKLQVRPTAHFLMGGLRIDHRAQTTIPGLYSAGESAGGVHGANRLGGNGLSEALVFGRIAGDNAALDASGGRGVRPVIDVVGSLRLSSSGGEFPDGVLQTLRTHMYRYAGPIRTETGLTKMMGLIALLEDRAGSLAFASGSRAAGQVQVYLDLQNLLLASKAVVEGALRRRESRGAHFREDFPQTNAAYEGSAVTAKMGQLVWTSYAYDDQPVPDPQVLAPSN